MITAAKTKKPWFVDSQNIWRRFHAASAIEPVSAPVPSSLLASEVAALPNRCLLAASNGLEVYVAPAPLIPNLLREIGRLRELTFRQVGEGTGRAYDLDRFDATYLHLFAWNPVTQEVAGAYRVADVGAVTRLHGLHGLYTATLFRYDTRFLTQLGGALELGRSFIRPEYQRKPASLLMLWRGIGAYVARNPSCPVLFGPVSISREYSQDARQVMVSFLQTRLRHDGRSAPVRPRHRFRGPLLRGWALRRLASGLENVDELDEVVRAMTGKPGIPILLRHYLQIGGRVAEFNVDPTFSSVLDALIVVDLRQTGPRHLQRYLGKEQAASFLRYHGQLPSPSALEAPVSPRA